jgi:hypothetical protein
MFIFAWMQAWQALLFLSMTSKRRAPASFDWHPIPDNNNDEPPPQPDVAIRHSHLNSIYPDLRLAMLHIWYLSASPSKRAKPSHYHDDYNWNEDPAPAEINDTTNSAFLDPAYTHFLDINEPGPPWQPRTVEVCAATNISVIEIFIYWFAGWSSDEMDPRPWPISRGVHPFGWSRRRASMDFVPSLWGGSGYYMWGLLWGRDFLSGVCSGFTCGEPAASYWGMFSVLVFNRVTLNHCV